MSIRFFVSRLVALISLCLAAGAYASSSIDAPHVHVELLIPGDTLYSKAAHNDAGIYFKLEPGWHIYWKNPGDAGLPPHVIWQLPEGVRALPLQFPAPQRLPLGSLVDYGYEHELLLPLHLQIAQNAESGNTHLRAKIDWLVCQNTCIPGKAELDVERNIDIHTQPPNRPSDALFEHFQSRIPHTLQSRSRAYFEETKNSFIVTLATGRKETQAIFFSEDGYIIDNVAPQRITPRPTGLILTLKKDEALSQKVTRLNGVLELSGGRAYQVTLEARRHVSAQEHAR